MSDYFKFKMLGEVEQARNVAKLEAAGLSLQDDPYTSANDGGFVSDMAGWHQVEYRIRSNYSATLT